MADKPDCQAYRDTEPRALNQSEVPWLEWLSEDWTHVKALLDWHGNDPTELIETPRSCCVGRRMWDTLCGATEFLDSLPDAHSAERINVKALAVRQWMIYLWG